MNLLSPQNYIPSNISTSLDEVEVSLRSAPLQLQKMYHQKYSSDVILKFLGKQYHTHRFVLQKTSDLFLSCFMPKNGEKLQFDIKTKGKAQLFTKILTCMYGFSTTIRRYDIHQAYDIAKALRIPSLLRLLQNDMISHFDQYDIFPLLKLATKEHLQQLIDLCYDQLEIQMFEPMRYNKSGLFLCEIELFKSIINRHNMTKSNNQKFGLSANEIQSLIDDYCFVNGIKKDIKDRMVEEMRIQKESYRNHMPINQLVRKPSTPQRVKSTSELFQRPTLTLPREKDQQNSPYHFPTIIRLSPCISPFYKNNDSVKNQINGIVHETKALGSASSINKSAISSKSNSLSNISTENISQQNRSRRQSKGSVETGSNSKENGLIMSVLENQNSIRQNHKIMKLKASQMLKKLTTQIQQTRSKSNQLHNFECSLDQLKAQMLCSTQKIKQLQKTVQNIEDTNNKIEMKEKFDKIFEASLPLDLTVSRQISLQKPLKV